MRILVTSGPTREPVDPVRFISNRSSGKMGHAVASVAAARGHDVRLVSGPVAIPPPDRVATTLVETTEQMLAAVLQDLPWADALVMAAAVADWKPRRPAPSKIKKGAASMRLDLEPTPDILLAVAARKTRQTVVGFAAETGNLLSEARRKLTAKKLDMIVANDVSRPDAGFENDNNRATLIASDGTTTEFELGPKTELATRIVEWIERKRG